MRPGSPVSLHLLPAWAEQGLTWGLLLRGTGWERALPQSHPQALWGSRGGIHPPCLTPRCLVRQELKPKSLDVRQEELGAMVDKEMAATSAAIEDAVRRIEVRTGGGGRSPGCASPCRRGRRPLQVRGEGMAGAWLSRRGSVADGGVGADQHRCPPSSHTALLPAHSKLLSGVGHDEPGPPCQLWGEAGGEREVSPTCASRSPRGEFLTVFPDLGRWVLPS